ncbi:hypothetical protein Pst134EB_006461 [Puccinia striiformis f. sp. tritici]|uniref:Uncharacterized protein n=3 Tax=Puccinia striiformis TaxID=27350 RepID=A0A0L0USH8_9BASI|nr:hypothetical protein Pst134EB_006461 [Puccinia striiformis f. sp. tritici]KNE89945.1 hypothetical protein PSTG_16590 [Puccinia striiformis f. sp. tritici PST-78]POW10411.1 hypothetical protein PSTT_06062 [Puccinia striiformis]
MEHFRCFRVQQISSLLMMILMLTMISLDTVTSNTLIESFGIPKNRNNPFQVQSFWLIKHSTTHQDSFKSNGNQDDTGGNVWIRAIMKEYDDELDEVADMPGNTTGAEESTESTKVASIKPNGLSRLQLKLNRTPLPQKYSYLFFVSYADETFLQAPNQAAETVKKNNPFHPVLNSINQSINNLLHLIGAPQNEHQQFSVRFSWDASDHIDLHLDLDQSPASLKGLKNPHFQPAFFNLTINTNFDKFSSLPPIQTDSFVDLIVIIEPLIFNLLPMFTILPLISTIVCILLFTYFTKLPSKFESFVKYFLT